VNGPRKAGLEAADHACLEAGLRVLGVRERSSGVELDQFAGNAAGFHCALATSPQLSRVNSLLRSGNGRVGGWPRTTEDEAILGLFSQVCPVIRPHRNPKRRISGLSGVRPPL
jgi:hypothetical protein